ncbi:cytidylyltransferase domain-containing protein [Lachnospiraceae bacterium C1.1]|nr:acylneuraminate cytidylyltransferase family protein [Lachnospiraceae bacterium C1.1]
MKRIAIIPARSGSKGLKDKNIRFLNGKPLIAYSIDAANKSNAFDTVFVSTDSKVYSEIAEKAGADAHFLRSDLNATDKASSWDAVREVIGRFEEEGKKFDEIMLLQPTSPLRTHEDIQNAIDVMNNKSALSVESLTEMDHSPLWANTLPEDGNMDNFFNVYSNMPRQDLPTYYRENGAIYLIKRELLYKPDSELFSNKCYAYIMPRERSIDIDVELDFKLAEVMMG